MLEDLNSKMVHVNGTLVKLYQNSMVEWINKHKTNTCCVVQRDDDRTRLHCNNESWRSTAKVRRKELRRVFPTLEITWIPSALLSKPLSILFPTSNWIQFIQNIIKHSILSIIQFKTLYSNQNINHSKQIKQIAILHKHLILYNTSSSTCLKIQTSHTYMMHNFFLHIAK